MLRTITGEPVSVPIPGGGTLVYGGRATAEAEVEASNAEKKNDGDVKANFVDVAKRDTC
jgi:hypothetical protein